MTADRGSGLPPVDEGRVALFLQTLREADISGEVVDDRAQRMVFATDNSVYEVVPAAVLFPASLEDLRVIVRLAKRHRVCLVPRGGGTGTNGQSLTPSVVVDVSRHMNAIVSFDPEEEMVIVQPGVVLEQLNAYLAPHGYFFPPSVSTASRATIGGMVSTDASGKGSRRYGRTSDHVHSLQMVLDDGTVETIGSGEIKPRSARARHIEVVVADQVAALREEIMRVYPEMNRGMTGYNLRDVCRPDGTLSLVKLIAGSEGTLGVISEIRLKVKRKPTHRAVTVISYEDCLTALGDVPQLLESDPVAVEFLDDRIVGLAANSPVWSGLENLSDIPEGAKGVLFVEIAESTTEAVSRQQAHLNRILSRKNARQLGWKTTTSSEDMAALWEMRSQAVGILASVEGARRGIPFVEDAAVPPENLVRFVEAFREMLDRYGLEYGMFGHADAGCVHVRPMLNMRLENDRLMVRKISDEVAALCRVHGGLIWGEHGKGYRGEYTPDYVGEKVFAAFCRIKAAFDPDDLFNPGKLARADENDALTAIDAVPFRGAADARIDNETYRHYEKAVSCNGNGVCFSWNPDSAMCPSFKATGDRLQSPKGRAALLREWIRSKSAGGTDVGRIEDALHRSLDSCLACKACTTRCPVQVDIPEMKSRFLESYYSTRNRPLRDYVIRHMEPLNGLARHFPRLANLVIGGRAGRRIFSAFFGLCDLPRFSAESLEASLASHRIPLLKPEKVRSGVHGNVDANQGAEHQPEVIVLADSFSASFDVRSTVSTALLLRKLGFAVAVSSVLQNGKALQVRGFLGAFDQKREQVIARLQKLQQAGAELVSTEPAVTMLYRHDYDIPAALGSRLMSLDEFLDRDLNRLATLSNGEARDISLFTHCTETSMSPENSRRWKRIFTALGQRVRVEKTGCCGMAGLFGHQYEHQGISKKLFDLSWGHRLSGETLHVATGFSCRSQAKRFSTHRIVSPAEALLDVTA